MEKISVTVLLKDNYKLQEVLSPNKKHLIQELHIAGDLHFNDYTKNNEFIRSMCNSIDEYGNRTGGQLELLDLSGVNKFSGHIDLHDCITLKKIALQLNTSHVPCASSYKGCVSLECIDYPNLFWDRYASINGALYQVRDQAENGQWNEREKYRLIKCPAAFKDPHDLCMDKVNRIDDYAFADFRGTDLYLPSTPPECSTLAFYNVDTTKVKIHVPKDAFNSYWAHSVWGEFQIVAD